MLPVAFHGVPGGHVFSPMQDFLAILLLAIVIAAIALGSWYLAFEVGPASGSKRGR